MKILYYNWADPLANHGGGVTVYLHALLQNFHSPKNEIYFLSSGCTYNNEAPFYRIVSSQANIIPNRFEIVSSSTVAPGQLEELKYSPEAENRTIATFLKFIDNHGPFDVIHAHNLEGLPLRGFVEARARYASTVFIITLHNYYPLCPEVELWDGRTYSSCENYVDGLRCHNCFFSENKEKEPIKRCLSDLRQNKQPIKRMFVKTLNKIQRHRKEKEKIFYPNDSVGKNALREALATAADDATDVEYLRRFLHPGAAMYQSHYENRRARFLTAISNTFDAAICVSKRVKEIYKSFGYDKLHVMYLGTQHAPIYQKTRTPSGPIPNNVEQFNIGYLGYATHSKGFQHFLKTLEVMPTALSQRIGVTIVARVTEPDIHYKIACIRDKFRFIRHIDGYTPLNFDYAIKDVSLIVVPHLWEEAFGLAAMEAHCRKIPLLCSDLGGTKEIANFDEFVFQHGDSNELIAKLNDIAAQKYTYEEYFQNALTPKNMREHIDELLLFYSKIAMTRKH